MGQAPALSLAQELQDGFPGPALGERIAQLG